MNCTDQKRNVINSCINQRNCLRIYDSFDIVQWDDVKSQQQAQRDQPLYPEHYAHTVFIRCAIICSCYI